MQSRRQFLGVMAIPAAAAVAGVPLTPPRFRPDWPERIRDLFDHPGGAAATADDEDFWVRVQQAFTVDRSLVNLNNGGVSPAPTFALDAMKRHLDFANQMPVYNGWQILEPQREGVRQRMAREWGVDTEEVAMTRNASESLQILQFGHDLR
jgi:hypothetical protein